MELVWNLGDHFHRLRPDGLERQGQALLVGQMLCPSLIRPTGRVDLLGVRFTPWGLHGMSHIGLQGLVDHIASAEHCSLAPPPSFFDDLADIPGLRTRCVRLADHLSHRLRNINSPVPSRAVSALAIGAVATVSQAAQLAGLSTRHLERLARSWTGLGPRELLKLARFRRGVQLLAGEARISLARIAAAAGYADQPHFNREFRRFSGVTPGQFRNHHGEITESFISATDEAMRPQAD